jgi:hypothetical protein
VTPVRFLAAFGARFLVLSTPTHCADPRQISFYLFLLQ